MSTMKSGLPSVRSMDARRKLTHLVAGRGAEARIDVCLDVGCGKGGERELLELTARMKVMLRAPERVLVGQVGGSEGPDQQQASGLVPPREVRDQIDRRGVAPLQVLEQRGPASSRA